MLLLNTGGTLNKRYDILNSGLEVPFDNEAINKILASSEENYNLAGVMYKDSLDMDTNDRKMLADIIRESTEDTIIIVHGTDTMHITAEFLSEVFEERKIILVGAMKPFELDKVESSLNIGMAIGFSKAIEVMGVYICMNGQIEIWDKLKKNRSKGKFELVE